MLLCTFLITEKDIGVIDPVSVVEPVRVVVVLQQLLISLLQQHQVFSIQAGVPDVVEDGHLLKLTAVFILDGRQLRCGDGFGPALG